MYDCRTKIDGGNDLTLSFTSENLLLVDELLWERFEFLSPFSRVRDDLSYKKKI